MGNRTLRITQSSDSTGQYRVKLALEGDGLAPQTVDATFEFELSPQHREDIRWYLEDYLQYPHAPAPTVAARIEGDLKSLGVDLFKKVFQSDDDARELWATLRQKLDDTRIEISTSVAEATSIPWELIRDPKTDAALALRATSFVRSQPQAAQRPELPQSESGPIRILLVICRPSGDDDVPFRSVATQLIKGLGDQAEDRFQLDVLRPATYERLSRVLNEAKTAGQPYHVVHFDGHGMYAEVPDQSDTSSAAEWLRRLIPLVLHAPGSGKHGFLLFEKPDDQSNVELISGSKLGELLVTNDVPLLVLNACRSAHAEAPTEPETGAGDNVHEQVRAFGSLAQEVMDAGVAGVVAMRYNVYVVTAAQFVADMYQTLVQGRSLGESVSMGRKQLAAKPDRTISFDPRPLQDWCVPIVYEAAPIELFPERTDDRPKITIRSGRSATDRGSLDKKLPRPPDVGFFGRDETLLALDRAFDTQPIVLLHAYAGSGKTSTAAEFARWYSLTGGVNGPVLFTSFETCTPLPRVLDRVGEVFGPMLEQQQPPIHWLTLEDDDRRDVALQVLKQIPALWIWDNVEPIAGFGGVSGKALVAGSDDPTHDTPAASAVPLTDTTYTTDERQALADFLRDAKQTQARILLTSRRNEQAWLANLPCRIAVPPMPMQERVQLARALAEHHQRRLTDVDDWRPLLRFTQGNPLTITVLVGQTLRDGLKTREQITTFVDKLRAGEAAFDDEASEGRTRSLGASLSYGFENAFTADQRRSLALLHLFQGFVDVAVLQMMGESETDWCLDAVRGLTRNEGMGLLDRAADVGLLTAAHGVGYYTIHPALPWFFKSLFDEYFLASRAASAPGSSEGVTDDESAGSPPPLAEDATLAFVEAIGELGNYYHNQYGAGNRDVIGALSAEEANLLHARRLARTHRWWGSVIGAMQGLRNLYGQTGRRAEWRRLVDEIVPDFVDPATDGPLPGREDVWSLVTQYRVGLARESRHWDEAERLQRVQVDWDRRRADEVIAAVETRRVSEGSAARAEISLADASGFLLRLQATARGLDRVDRNTIRTYQVSLHELGQIQRERQQPECVAAYEESLAVAEAIDDRAGAASCAFNLGHSYWGIYVPAIRDLAKAEQWYRRSLELRDEQDRQSRGGCLAQIGALAIERFRESQKAGEPESELLRHVNEAVQSYQQALELLPDNAVKDLTVAHGALAVIFSEIGDADRALPHYRDAIRFTEPTGNQFQAGQIRFNVAIALLQSRRLSDAQQYALAALRDFQSYGDRAADMTAKTKQLLADIEQAIQEQGA
ncbi:MAG: tetratricopeptide (TPR) repeat protein [Planctomycetaceae bacterium]|jgi:tetratricopeptide (TPR) repeat protein